MKSFGDKVKEHRGRLGLSQKQLAERSGIGLRSITAYELGSAKPHAAQIYKLAVALDVSTEYLQNDSVEDPSYGKDRMEYVEQVRRIEGSKDALDLQQMLAQNRELFAGGSISETAKDAYFQALMQAYLECKQAAKDTYGKKEADPS